MERFLAAYAGNDFKHPQVSTAQCSPRCFAYGVPLYSSSPRFVHLAFRRNIRHHYNIEGMTPLTCMFYYFLYSRFFLVFLG